MMQVVGVVLGLIAWWGCACRMGQMQLGTHRTGAVVLYAVLAAAALAAVGVSASIAPAAPLGALVGCCLCLYLGLTLPDWMYDPPVKWRVGNPFSRLDQ